MLEALLKKKNQDGRFRYLYWIIIVIFIILVSRLVYLQLFAGEYYHTLAEGNRLRAIPIAAMRGIMYDRNGQILVGSRPSFMVTYVPPKEGMSDEELQKLGVDVYAVSTDTHFTHKAWHSSSETIAKIKYAMIGDPTGALTRNFDNMREDEGLADRATFVVDPQGIIQAIEVTAEGIGRDASDLLRKIKAAQYVASHPGEVCPAKWKEGEATLAPSLDLVGKI